MPETPMTPTPPTTPAGSGPSSVRAIVNWLETSGTNSNGGKADKAGSLPAVGWGGRARTTGTLATPSPQSPSSRPPPPPMVVTPPRSNGRSIEALQPTTPVVPAAAPAVSAPLISPVSASSVLRGEAVPQDYSLTLLRHTACFNQPQSTNRGQEKNAIREPTAAVRTGPGKKKSYGELGKLKTSSSKTAEELSEHSRVKGTGGAGAGRSNLRPRRHKDDVSAYWSSVRGYLLITDEEIYGP